MKKFLKNWKTTLSGIVGVLIFALGALDVEIANIDNWGEAAGTIGGMIGISLFSRDADKSSEETNR